MDKSMDDKAMDNKKKKNVLYDIFLGNRIKRNFWAVNIAGF
jgi:hypothetical protein